VLEKFHNGQFGTGYYFSIQTHDEKYSDDVKEIICTSQRKKEKAQPVWGKFSRLIANCIIYYNARILSNILIYREANKQDSDLLKQISPVG
jgi:hypothetical protein